MVDYSKFDNIVLSSDEEEENERKNLEEHFENSDLRNTSPIIFAEINQIPEMTVAIDKLKGIIARLHPQKIVKDITLGVLQNINNLSILWKENIKKKNIFLLVNHEILKRHMDEQARRKFFESVAGFGGHEKLNNVLVIFSPSHDKYWYQADCDAMDNNTMERWYQSWMVIKCCVCHENDDVNTKMEQCGTCFSCVCKGCLLEHKEVNNYPLLKCPICRTPFYKIVEEENYTN
jgi:hypothetical protein